MKKPCHKEPVPMGTLGVFVQMFMYVLVEAQSKQILAPAWLRWHWFLPTGVGIPRTARVGQYSFPRIDRRSTQTYLYVGHWLPFRIYGLNEYVCDRWINDSFIAVSFCFFSILSYYTISARSLTVDWIIIKWVLKFAMRHHAVIFTLILMYPL